ncbi:MAG TPA: universal stress protein [Micrococcaceae bacterium]|jgi:nucleotide-binding universal stress UspA family protein
MTEESQQPDRSGSPGPVVVGVIPAQPPAVVDHAVTLAVALGTSLVCAYVDPTSYTTTARREGAERAVAIDPDAGESLARQQGDRIEKVLASRLEGCPVGWTFQALAGEPARELSRLAERSDASFIVVGTREPGLAARLEEFLSGSVALHLAHHQNRPVVVVPLHPKPFGTGNP